MLLFNGGEIWDYDLDFFKDVVNLVDGRFQQLEADCDACGDPDQFGLLDQAEHIAGLGFTAAQTYLVSVAAEFQLRSWEAYGYGPRHERGLTIAQLVNHAANWWKHQIQWSPDDSDPRRSRTIEGLSALDLESDYPLTTALALLTNTDFPRLAPLVPLLVGWRDALVSLARSGDSVVVFRKRGAGV